MQVWCVETPLRARTAPGRPSRRGMSYGHGENSKYSTSRGYTHPLSDLLAQRLHLQSIRTATPDQNTTWSRELSHSMIKRPNGCAPFELCDAWSHAAAPRIMQKSRCGMGMLVGTVQPNSLWAAAATWAQTFALTRSAMALVPWPSHMAHLSCDAAGWCQRSGVDSEPSLV